MIPKPIELAHSLLRDHVQSGDAVIDATVGNGHDTAFLAELVGEQGRVIGFDLQQAAVDSARQRLENAGMLNCCELHAVGHERMGDFVEGQVAAVMFNFGYLPGGDKSIITRESTSLRAVEAATQMLAPGGLITLMCYPGHKGGDTESVAISAWTSQLSRQEWRVMRYEPTNAPHSPPFLIVVERRAPARHGVKSPGL